MSEIIVLLGGNEAGRVSYNKGKMSFSYTDAWRSASNSYPLSLSMPLAGKVHPHSAIEPFIWGLLPDNDQVLARKGREFSVSPRNAFRLISFLGEDCAGAVQFIRPERLATMLEGEMPEPNWLSEAEVTSRLRTVREYAGTGRSPGDFGQFSLAGMQPKTSLLYFNGRWGITSGKTPTSHILKPTSVEMDGQAENEHLCLSLAKALGMPTAQSRVLYFEDVPTIVVTRFDRIMVAEAAAARKAIAIGMLHQVSVLRAHTDALSTRQADELETEANADLDLAVNLLKLAETQFVSSIHQEDLCQTLGIHPSLKFQNDGGPSPKQITNILRTHVSSIAAAKSNPKFPFAVNDDINTFIDALVFNWIIGGTDAHAKNYSLMIGSGGMVRLAPLYDVSSFLASRSYDPHTATLSMKIGDHYRLARIGLSDWKKFATDARVDEADLFDRIKRMASELPDRLSDEIKIMRDAGLTHNVIDTLGKILPERATKISAM
jgi:serine/threonine-protein kinase HipA